MTPQTKLETWLQEQDALCEGGSDSKKYAAAVADKIQRRRMQIEPWEGGQRITNPGWKRIYGVALNAHRTGSQSRTSRSQALKIIRELMGKLENISKAHVIKMDAFGLVDHLIGSEYKELALKALAIDPKESK